MDECVMTAKETLRLWNWLRAKGFTDEEAHSCLEYITNTSGTPEGNKKSDAPNPEK